MILGQLQLMMFQRHHLWPTRRLTHFLQPLGQRLRLLRQLAIYWKGSMRHQLEDGSVDSEVGSSTSLEEPSQFSAPRLPAPDRIRRRGEISACDRQP